jgi:diguanylate cyclase (GGDEF)-like protein
MDTTFDPTLGTLLWMALSLPVLAVAAQLSLAWLEPALARDRSTWLGGLAGAGLSLGTGIWSVHGISTQAYPVDFAVGSNPWAELAVWLLAVCASIAALAWMSLAPGRSTHAVVQGTRECGPPSLSSLTSVALRWLGRARLPRWLGAACGLGSVVVALQMLATLSSGWEPGITWHAGPLALAWLSCLGGCLLAFGLFDALRGKDRRAIAWGRAVAGLILAVAVVQSQHLVTAAANLASQSESVFSERLSSAALCGWALLGSGALLLALRVLLRRHGQWQTARIEARREAAMQSLNDPLTGLPNRQLFEGTLAQAVQQADAGRRRLALLLINLDGFKPVNQSFGHEVGDQVLREVAARLRALTKPHMAARLAGDEFLMLMTDDPLLEDASALASAALASIALPLKAGSREMSITCSIGVTMYPEHGALSALIGHADAAMRAAKAAGGASHAFFEARMINGSRDQAELLRDLRVALERGQLELYYQPKIHAPSGEITGAEALMRWHHPQRGMVSPIVFIPIAERYGLIGALGQWVIDEACRQARAWRDTGLRMRVAINLSVHQLRQADLAERIASALRRHQINPDLITCELTESAAMDDTEVTTRVLGQLAKVGVHISIDDFGTGHSSLSYLRKLPAQELKIDRSFVQDLETSEDARMVASAVVNLAKALHLQVVAEGVETEGQNRILREFGCDQLQGFLFAKPMSAKALALWAMNDVGPRSITFRESLFKETMTAEEY